MVRGSDPSCPEQTLKTGGLPNRSPQSPTSARVDTSEEDAILEGDLDGRGLQCYRGFMHERRLQCHRGLKQGPGLQCYRAFKHGRMDVDYSVTEDSNSDVDCSVTEASVMDVGYSVSSTEAKVVTEASGMDVGYSVTEASITDVDCSVTEASGMDVCYIVTEASKLGQDVTSPGSYKPISLTSSLCKVLDTMVNRRLPWFLEKNNLSRPSVTESSNTDVDCSVTEALGMDVGYSVTEA
ncbi:hypothetical protein J6590_094749 [Homalodisca vitripennis]|nr:hypothetical protein J6590_094749 [Homalodisca vitripennis]